MRRRGKRGLFYNILKVMPALVFSLVNNLAPNAEAGVQIPPFVSILSQARQIAVSLRILLVEP